MTGDLFAPSTGKGGRKAAAATSLASIYHAKKSGDTSVNLLKRQFQTQVERVIHDSRGQPGQVRILHMQKCDAKRMPHKLCNMRTQISLAFSRN